MKKQIYFAPKMEISFVETNDVIATSAEVSFYQERGNGKMLTW